MNKPDSTPRQQLIVKVRCVDCNKAETLSPMPTEQPFCSCGGMQIVLIATVE